MCISHMILPLVTCTLLLLASTSGEGQLHKAHENTPDMESMDSQAVLLLEAVKTGILSSLGMDVEPRLTQKASKKELREMYQLYRRKIREIRGNSSQPMGENSQSTMSTVLFPGTDENSVRRGRPLEPYLAAVIVMWKARLESLITRRRLRLYYSTSLTLCTCKTCYSDVVTNTWNNIFPNSSHCS